MREYAWFGRLTAATSGRWGTDMTMTVRLLLERPRLQLALVGGASGLDREITWAHASDLPAPWDWLGPGELLLTNGTGIGASPAAQVDFVERLGRIGASGLVMGLGTGGAPVTRELARRAFDALGRQLGLRLHLVDAGTGTSVFDDETIDPLGQALAESVAEHGHAIPGLLRLSRDGSADGEVCALAVAGAVQLAQIVAERRRRRQQGAEMLAQLLDRHRGWRLTSGEPSVDGIDFAASVLMVLRSAEPETEDALHRACARARVASLLLQRGDLLYAVLPEQAVTDRLVFPAADLTSAAGASADLGSADRIAEASTEAVWALGIAEANQLRLARYGDDIGLLMPRSPAEARGLVDRVLGELLAYDRAHGTRYVETVRAFVQADGSWQRAAAGLHVHKQTLGYRLRKVEELTGRGFSRTQHMAEWWFALQAFDLLTAVTRRA